jgi:hypothetical protein
MKSNDININLNQPSGEDKVSSVTKAVKGVADTIADASWKRIVKAYLVMFFFLATTLGGIFLYKFTTDKDAMHEAALRIAKAEKEENLREEVITPKIQKNLDAVLYTLNADRAYLLEFHNGKRNTTGLPFRYMDISYEVTNQESKVTKIGMFYQNVPTTLYKFPYYLQEHKYYIGTLEDFGRVDEDLAKQMSSNFAKYFAVIALNSDGTPLGYLGISWCSEENVPDTNVIKSKLFMYDKTFSQLLDLRIQMMLND